MISGTAEGWAISFRFSLFLAYILLAISCSFHPPLFFGAKDK